VILVGSNSRMLRVGVAVVPQDQVASLAELVVAAEL
jgi:hypothetical protein